MATRTIFCAAERWSRLLQRCLAFSYCAPAHCGRNVGRGEDTLNSQAGPEERMGFIKERETWCQIYAWLGRVSVVFCCGVGYEKCVSNLALLKPLNALIGTIFYGPKSKPV